MHASAIVLSAALSLVPPHSPQAGPLPTPPNHANCVSPAQREEIALAIRAYEQSQSLSLTGPRDLPTYLILPIGATLYEDLLPPGYVDHDPTAGISDYSCHDFTYDTHRGTDFGLRSFDEQAIGVPVYAAADGTVVYSHDGEPDTNTCICGQLGNAVTIDHGGGRYGLYFHMKNGSVTAFPGDKVRAGQQLGLAASSGSSAGPHLHFETNDNSGTTVFDPFAGPCSQAASGWTTQPAMDLSTFIADFGYSTENLSSYWGYPYSYPVTGQMGFDQFLWFWAHIVNLPPHSNWRQEYIRPNGTIAFDSGTIDFESNQTAFYRNSRWWWYTYYIPEMRSIAGTWKIRLRINGVNAIEAPIEVKPAAVPGFNRPPATVALAFDPPSPTHADVLFCRVNASRTLDDLDYDLVRYHYVWKRNGETIRDLTSAGRADCLPRGYTRPGDQISCTVTPNDGKVNGTPTVLNLTVEGCPGDYNGDLFTDAIDYDQFIADWLSAAAFADYNADTFVDAIDYDEFISDWLTPC